MEYLKEKILKDGKIKEGGILKVDSFLNHQIDVECLNEIGKEFKRRFSDVEVNKILTIEASGIAVAVIAAQYFKVPVVFAKKVESKNLDNETYEAMVYSYTKDRTYTIKVSQKYLNKNDKILIVDDFLAHGSAAIGLIEIVEQEGLELDRVIIAHVDRFPDWWYHKKMLEKGVNIIYDGPGKAKYYPDSMRVDLIKKIIEHGFEKQLMLSNDMGRRSHHKVYGYGPGFEFIPTKFIPRLLEEGISQNSIDNFMIYNPARVYSLKEI